MSLQKINESVFAIVAAGAMAVCEHRHGGGHAPAQLVAEVPGSKCNHPEQPGRNRTCAVAHCPVAAKLTPQLVANLSTTVTSSLLDRIGVAGGVVRDILNAGVAKIASGLSADKTGGVGLR